MKKKFSAIFKKYPVAAAYLFGSRANGQVGPMSDYDFAIQLDDNLTPSKYLNIKSKVVSDLIGAVNNNAVDLVVLNEAPLLLKYQILRYGKPIYVSKPAQKASFVFNVIQKYLDWDYFQEKFSAALIKRTAKKGLNV